MAASTHKPLSLLRIGTNATVAAAFTCWLVLGGFDLVWSNTCPRAPTGAFIYAHVEHGGLCYFNAEQSTASHLWLPIVVCAFFAIVADNLSRGKDAFKRSRYEDGYNTPQLATMTLAAVVAIALIFLFGTSILDALAASPFGPGSDSLGGVRSLETSHQMSK